MPKALPRTLTWVEARSSYLLWTALRWAAAALQQAERVRASFEQYQASVHSRMGAGVVRLTPEMERPKAIFWADVHFLMIAVNHLRKVLGDLGGDAPRIDKALEAKAVELRHLLEHWWKRSKEKAHGRAIAKSMASMRSRRTFSSSLAMSESVPIRCPSSPWQRMYGVWNLS